jgi:hypothetical protein
MKKQGHWNESERHVLQAKGIKTKEHKLMAYGNEISSGDMFDNLHNWLDKHGIQFMPTETMDWYESIISDNTPQYFFYTDWGEYTFLKSNKAFTEEEMNHIENTLKKILEYRKYS